MKNYNSNPFQTQQKPLPRASILEQSKLSRLPSLAKREPSTLFGVPDTPNEHSAPNSFERKLAATFPVLNNSVRCAGCGKSIDRRQEREYETQICRTCVKLHLAIDDKIRENEIAKNRRWLENSGGVDDK